MINYREKVMQTLKDTYFGKMALEGKVDDVLMKIGHDREFFRLAKLPYGNPQFDVIERAVIEYRRANERQ